MRFCVLLQAATNFALVGAVAAARTKDENHKLTDVVEVASGPRLRSSARASSSSQTNKLDDVEKDDYDDEEEEEFDSHELQKRRWRREKWWARYKLEFGKDRLKKCRKLKGVQPVDGTPCPENESPPGHRYFCMFGSQECLSPQFGWVHPTVKCDCIDGNWDCDDWDPECSDEVMIPLPIGPPIPPVSPLCEATDCVGCVESGCSWAARSCLRDCNQIADVSCYSKENFENQTSNEICQIEKDRVRDSRECGIKKNCGDCVGTNLPSDANRTCLWHAEFKSCQSSCGRLGCGSAECSVLPAPIPDTIDIEPLPPGKPPLPVKPLPPVEPLPPGKPPLPVEPLPVSSGTDEVISLTCDASDCLDCVTQGCGWAVGSCLSNCGFIADAACYSLVYFEGKTPAEVCQIEQDAKDNSQACSGGKTCEDCVSIDLPAPDEHRTSCLWLQFGDTGFCQSSCGMLGCGTDTCEAPPGIIEIVEP